MTVEGNGYTLQRSHSSPLDNGDSALQGLPQNADEWKEMRDIAIVNS
jgi:hypothetical protein